MASQLIRHEGIVQSVDNDKVVVRIVQASACASCSAAKLCQSSESKEKLVVVRSKKAFEAGQHVVLTGSIRQGLKATWLAYVIPLVCVVAVIAMASLLGLNEGLAAVSGLAVLALYYFIMYAMRARFEDRFGFAIQTI